MAFPAEPAGPVAAKRRPGTVTAACWLLYVAAALNILTAMLSLTQIGAIRKAFINAFRDTPLAGTENVYVAIAIALPAIIGVLFAAAYVVLAILDGKGKNPARIVTWVIGGIAVCYGGCTLISTAVGTAGFGGPDTGGGPSAEDIQRELERALPDWFQPATITISLVDLLAVLAALILLALPISNEFFRKQPEQVWEPPVPPVPPPTA